MNRSKLSCLTPLVALVLAAAASTALAAPADQDRDAQLPPPAEPGDFIPATPEQVELGRLLFFDKILSGNFNVSCATCHHALTDTGDGLSLPVGEGGRGLGMARNVGTGGSAIHERVPRNAPPVFNLGAREFTIMFHDGRVAADPRQPSGFLTPAGDAFPLGLDSALAAQAMFPVTSGAEMAGQAGENPIGDAAAAGWLAGPDGVWELLAERLRGVREYVELFRAAYPDEVRVPGDITMVQVANAIAAFEGQAWRSIDSPFDQLLRGDRVAVTKRQRQGLKLFYGKAGCSGCHAGTYLTDHDFHAIAMPQIGPGKGDGRLGFEDFGRGRETGLPADLFKFRTPPLRNVALTGPWGHDGAYDTLEAIVRHHLLPVASLTGYDRAQCVLPPGEQLPDDFQALDDPLSMLAIADACELLPVQLNEQEFDALIDFLHTLTDPAALDLRHDVPFVVPSGLPVAD